MNSALRLHASALSSRRPAILSVSSATPAVYLLESTAHPRKSGAPYFISGSYKNDSDNWDYYFIVMLAIEYSIFAFGMEYFFHPFFKIKY